MGIWDQEIMANLNKNNRANGGKRIHICHREANNRGYGKFSKYGKIIQ